MAVALAATIVAGCGAGPSRPVPSASMTPTSTPGATASSPEAPSTEEITVRAVLVADGGGARDGLTAPIALVSPPGEPDRRLVVDQVGEVRQLTEDGVSERPFLDLRESTVRLWSDRDDERGLLGVAFSPDYRRDRSLYVFRTAPSTRAGFSHVNTLSRFLVGSGGRAVDRDSEQVVWSSPQQEPSHAAGQIAFDARGRLLLFLGDGQALGAQDPRTPNGKVLRFDLGRRPVRPTVVARGLRHPWRLSYDPPTRQWLMAEPNFTARFQEINAFVEGANYGWQIDTVPAACWGLADAEVDPDCTAGPDGQRLTPPVAEYGPSLGLIVSGAHIYRADAVPRLRDRLVVAEWGVSSGGGLREGRLLVSAPVDRPPYRLTQATLTGIEGRPWFWSLARDADGELYLMTMAGKAPEPGGGAVYRLAAAE